MRPFSPPRWTPGPNTFTLGSFSSGTFRSGEFAKTSSGWRRPSGSTEKRQGRATESSSAPSGRLRSVTGALAGRMRTLLMSRAAFGRTVTFAGASISNDVKAYSPPKSYRLSNGGSHVRALATPFAWPSTVASHSPERYSSGTV